MALTSHLLAFSDASPQESIDPAHPERWYTFAAVGVRLASDPFGAGLVVPVPGGVASVLTIPDPAALEESLRTGDGTPYRDWKKIRGAERRSAALDRLLRACSEGNATFFAHSTLGEYVPNIVDQFFGVSFAAAISGPALLRQLGYSSDALASIIPPTISRRNFVSLGWIARCCCILHEKSAESLGDVNVLVLHDNLPFNRESDVALIQVLLGAILPRKVKFTAGVPRTSFAPVDNLAAAANACITHTDGTIDQWVLVNGRPQNVYITMDEPNGTFVRYL